jgi:hypothetical protein
MGLVINGLGAVTTAIVTVVIAVTKFADGAWAVMLFVPAMVWLLVRMNRQYARERAELDEGLVAFVHEPTRRPLALVLVDDLDRRTLHALQYAKTTRAGEIRALHLQREDGDGAELLARWNDLGIDVPLRLLRSGGGPAAAIGGYAAAFGGDADVNVIVPGPARTPPLERLRRGRAGARLTRALAPYPNVRMTLVRDHEGPGHEIVHAENGDRRVRLTPREGHRVIVLVDRADRAVLRAVQYALSLGAQEVRAVHAAVDPDAQEELIARWMDLRIPIELDLVECWDRDVARSLERYVVEKMGPRAEVTVVLPRRDFATLRQRLLHDRTSRRITKALNRYAHVDIAVVPFYFPERGHPGERTVTTPLDVGR